MKKNKIISFINLEKKIKDLKKNKKRIVLCHGVFDLLHPGHFKHFKTAKNYGDILIVSVTADNFVNKGPDRPAFNEKLRLESLISLSDIDFVVLSNFATAKKIIKVIKPNFYCKGPDYKNHKNDASGEIINETKEVKKYGGKIIYTEDENFSSSNLINKYLLKNENQTKLLLKKVKKKYDSNKIKNAISSFDNIKILIIGETIIDKYIFSEALGKSGKEPILVLRDLSSEEYVGGAAAIARHISNFNNKVSLLSMIGEKKEYLNFIKKKLRKNVKLFYLEKKGSPTIVKTRFIDNVSKNKVFGSDKLNDELLDSRQENDFNSKLKKIVPKFDLVIVSDYGHGFISKNSAQIICKYSKFLALNAQVNAANIGYHTMRNYKNIDCVIINEKELRHELRDKNSKTEKLQKELSNKQNIKNLIVTKGSQGSILYAKNFDKFIYAPAFSNKVVDKVGAGDTMLSIISMCINKKLDLNLSLLIASIAAAESVKKIGNKFSTNKINLIKSLEAIIK